MTLSDHASEVDNSWTDVDDTETSADDESVVLADTLVVTLTPPGTTHRAAVRLTMTPVTPAH